MEHLPHEEIRPVSDLFPGGVHLLFTAANETPIPYLGYVDLLVTLNKVRHTEIQVPFLVTDSKAGYGILGNNVIEEVITHPLHTPLT